jgi:hypothetical protein
MLWIGGLLLVCVVLVAIFYAVMIAAALALAGIVLLAIMELYARFRIWRSRS